MGYVVPGLFAILLVEALAATRWWPPYFTIGLVVYRKSIPWSRSAASVADVGALEERFRGGFGPSLVFCEIGPGEMAFREKLFEFKFLSYTPVMHGLLRLRPERGVVEVEGRANWFSMAFCAAFAIFLWALPDAWPLLAFLAVLLGGIGSIQATRYARVGTYVAEGAPVGEAAPKQQATASFLVLTAIVIGLLVVLGLWWMSQ